jgi:histidinol-phosphate aminotransferase
MRHVARKSILNVSPYIPGKPIDEVKRELGLKEVIKLASNENPYGPSPKVLASIRKATTALNRYPDGDCFYLREALAKKLKVSKRQLIFGNGSDELIVMAIRAFVNEADEVVIAKPSFLIYDIASQIAGAHIKAVPLNGFHYDLEGMKRAVSPKTKIIFLGNPDNPAGTFIEHDPLRNFISSLRSDILIFIDEAYYEYVDDKSYADSLKLLNEFKNVFVIRTFSKMYGLAGLRIGYGIGQEEVVDLLNRVREPFNINSLAQVAALACLNDQTYYRKIAQAIKKERQFLYKSFARLKLQFEKSYTNFILIKIKGDSTVLTKQLMQKGVIIRDMSHWGLSNYIRVTIGTSQENKRFIKALEEIL